jgi:hypothetical protein
LQAQRPEFKPQTYQNKVKNNQSKKRLGFGSDVRAPNMHKAWSSNPNTAKKKKERKKLKTKHSFSENKC